MASQAGLAGCLQSGLVPAGCWLGEYPCPVAPGQAAADEVAQVEGGGPVLEPGVVTGDAEVAEFEAPSAAAGDLGDHPLNVGPVLVVVLAQRRLRGPGGAGRAQHRVVGVQLQGAAGLGGCAPGAQRAGGAAG